MNQGGPDNLNGKRTNKDEFKSRKKSLLNLDYGDFVDKFYQGQNSVPDVEKKSSSNENKPQPVKSSNDVKKKKHRSEILEPIVLLHKEILGNNTFNPKFAKLINEITLDSLNSKEICELNLVRKEVEILISQMLKNYLGGQGLDILQWNNLKYAFEQVGKAVNDYNLEKKLSTALFLGLELIFCINTVLLLIPPLNSFRNELKEINLPLPDVLKGAIPDKNELLILLWRLRKHDHTGLTNECEASMGLGYFKQEHWKNLRSSIDVELGIDIKHRPDPKDKFAKDETEFRDRADRGKHIDYLVKVYDRSGASDKEIIGLLHSEANRSDSELILAEFLTNKDRFKEALDAAFIGYEKKYKYKELINISYLKGQFNNLVNLAIKSEQRPLAVSLLCERFFKVPTLEDLESIKECCLKMNNWLEIQPFINEFLFSGKIPKNSSKRTWPFPEPPALSASSEEFENEFELYEKSEEIMRISLLLQNVELLKQTIDKENWLKDSYIEDTYFNVPEYPRLLAEKYPTYAIKAWKHFLFDFLEYEYESERGFDEALDYLKEAKDLCLRHKKANQWKKLVAEIKSNHPRKKKLIESLQDEV